MKRYYWLTMLLGVSPVWAQQLEQPVSEEAAVASPVTVSVLGAPPYSATEHGQDFTRWQQISLRTNRSGRITAQTNGYMELETSRHFLNENGKWESSREEIQLAEVGAVGRTSPHKVTFSGNIDSQVSLRVVTPDNTQVKLRPLGLAYFDFHTRDQVLFAELKDSTGELVGTNQALYPDAFTGCRADIRYTYKKSGIEQDIILRQRPPSPEAYGLNPATTWLWVLTEVIDPPGNVEIVREIRRGWKKSTVDKLIRVGDMTIGPGTAFSLGVGDDRNAGIPVQKHWAVLEGRTFLIEEVNFRQIQAGLEALQASTQPEPGPGGSSGRRLASKKLVLPAVRTAGASPDKSFRIASAKREPAGFVVDFNLQSGTGVVLTNGQTFYVAGTVNLTNAVIEGGAVVKYARGASINLLGSITCKTGPYRPAILTAVDDDSVGATISGSTGSPSGQYAACALSLGIGGDLRYLNIRYASNAIYCANNNYGLHHSQILCCNVGLHSESAYFAAGNVLMSQVLTNYYGHLFGGQIVQFTSDQAGYLFYDRDFYIDEDCAASTSSGIQVINSITTAVTNYAPAEQLSAISTIRVANASNGIGVFQAVGAGYYYLADDTYRDAGSLYMYNFISDTNFLNELRQKTTFPPLVYSNITATANIALAPHAQRDTDLPDLGYHYDPIDYLTYSFIITNATLTITNGTSIGYYDYPGIWLKGGAPIICKGTATTPNRFVNYRTVQEMPVKIGAASQLPVSNNRGGGAPASAVFRFTDFYRMPGGSSPNNIYSDGSSWTYTDLEVRNCKFFGGGAQFMASSGSTFGLTNNLFTGGYISVYGDFAFSAYNNLFQRSSVFLGQSGATQFVIRDNSFDSGFLSDTEGDPVTHDHNALINNTVDLNATEASDLVLANFLYTSGPLGDYYQLSTNLINQGSTTANVLGFYHYTTQTNQFKETNSIVDIGFHYIAVNGNTTPFDADGDGIADYLEDFNGNGVYDAMASETDWQSYNSANALAAGSGLQVFTPLK